MKNLNQIKSYINQIITNPLQTFEPSASPVCRVSLTRTTSHQGVLFCPKQHYITMNSFRFTPLSPPISTFLNECSAMCAKLNPFVPQQRGENESHSNLIYFIFKFQII